MPFSCKQSVPACSQSFASGELLDRWPGRNSPQGNILKNLVEGAFVGMTPWQVYNKYTQFQCCELPKFHSLILDTYSTTLYRVQSTTRTSTALCATTPQLRHTAKTAIWMATKL
jgi:hypothetical protein